MPTETKQTMDLDALAKELEEAGFSPKKFNTTLWLREPYVDVHDDGWISIAAFVPKSPEQMNRFVQAISIVSKHAQTDGATT